MPSIFLLVNVFELRLIGGRENGIFLPAVFLPGISQFFRKEISRKILITGKILESNERTNESDSDGTFFCFVFYFFLEAFTSFSPTLFRFLSF